MSRVVYAAPSVTERSFVVFVLLLSTGAFLNLSSPRNSADPDAGSLGMQVLWSLIYVVTLVLVFKHCNKLWERLKTELWLILLVGFALSSALWSGVPLLTIRRGVALVCTTLFGIYLAERYPLRSQLRLLGVAFAIAAIASVFFELLGIGAAVDEGVRGWIGVYVQKNVLGFNMAFAAAAMLILRRFDLEYKGWATVGAVLTGALLILSQSMTAMIMFLVTLAAFPLCRFLRNSYRVVTVGGLITVPLLACSIVWTFHNLDKVTGLMGRDPTLTGRLPLWILSVVMAFQRPWFGYGYNAFWRGWDGPSAAIWGVLSWRPPHSHNGLLEVWLGLGIIGVALFLIGFLVYFRRAIRFLRVVHSQEGYWPLVFLILMFLSNLTAANILSRNTMFWIMYVAAGVTTARCPAALPQFTRTELHHSMHK